MPQFKNAPERMNRIMEEAYSACIKKGGSKEYCSKIAISIVKKLYRKTKDGRWVKK